MSLLSEVGHALTLSLLAWYVVDNEKMDLNEAVYS
jgi:hypothetical protein